MLSRVSLSYECGSKSTWEGKETKKSSRTDGIRIEPKQNCNTPVRGRYLLDYSPFCVRVRFRAAVLFGSELLVVGETASAAPPGFLRFSVAGAMAGVIVVGVGAAAGVATEGPGVDPDPDACGWCGVAWRGLGVPFMAAGLSTIWAGV